MENKIFNQNFATTVISISGAFAVYLYLFQYPKFFSKRSLVFAILAGLAFGLIWLVWSRIRDERFRLRRNILIQASIITVAFIMIFGIPNFYSLAPEVTFSLSIPSESDGGKAITIQSINSDVEDLWYHQLPLSESLIEGENSRILIPGSNEVTQSFSIRSWDRVFIQFGPETPQIPIRISIGNNLEEYYPVLNPDDGTIVTSVQVPNFWRIQFLSDILVILSLLIIFYTLLLMMNELTWLDHDPKVFSGIFQVLMCLLLLLGFLGINPIITPLARDSGVYTFIGKSLLDGKVPYRDVWDHKGPVTYLINALGLSTGIGRWGTWAIEYLSSVFTVLLIFRFLKKTVNLTAAVTASFVFIVTIFRFTGTGNYVETYAILLYVLTLYLFNLALQIQKPTSSRMYFAIGITSGVTFLIRPNLISPILAIGLVLLASHFQKYRNFPIKSLSRIFTGLILTFAVFAFYLVINQAFMDFIYAVFRHNVGYSNFKDINTQLSRMLSIFIDAPFLMMVSGISFISLILCLLRSRFANQQKIMLSTILIAAIIELFLYNLSGRDYLHYNISLLPYICLVIGWGTALLTDLHFMKSLNEFRSIQIISILIILFLIPGAVKTIQSRIHFHPEKDKQDNLVSELRAKVPESDFVLFWGAETAYYYLLDVDPPNRYIYQFPFTWCDLISGEDIVQFVDDLASTESVIVDASYTNVEIHSLKYEEHHGGCPQLEPLFNYFNHNYQPVSTLSNQWIIYEHHR